ncbi:uncharacterized protein I303_101286 [Kwoniella dejecticola CBS 10117]|uniref:Uncharacterized protein n=1 Tax=Kwoniella dejecticola CBS 10117 TaxID=1296121 RepID=A0A1A6AHC1_9TREE|nr:uncharacterized protein I303_01294 [Kwoniella dejecticola CBS 10117]OBR89467.1 hypothetical protein I303_01294 [Kwoniella dejecticola CBS 10117]
MYNSKKRPSTNKPFNPAHTHPASISSIPSIQTRQHTSSSLSASSSKEKPAVPKEGIQSGGGGGGGVGAGSEEGIDGMGIDAEDEQKDKDKGKKNDNDKKWSDPKIVHPASDVWGKGPTSKKQEGGEEKSRDGKAKL